MTPRVEYEKNISIITQINEMISCFRRQNYNRAERMFPTWSQSFSQTIEVLFSSKDYFNRQQLVVDEMSIMEVMKGVLQAQEQGDYVLLADLLELQLVPFLYLIQETIRQNEGSMIFSDHLQDNLILLEQYQGADQEEYRELSRILKQHESGSSVHFIAEDTELGCPTLKYTDDKREFYLHSNHDPVAEGWKLANEYYNEDLEQYTVYGLGLGYHIEALDALCDHTSRIDVYESNLDVILHAFTYRNMNTLLSGNVRLHYDPKLMKLGKMLEHMSGGLMLHAPSIRSIQNEDLGNSMNELFVQESSVRNQGPDMLRNFKSNTRECKLYADILSEDFKGKTVFIIAAGPSLDKNIALLKNQPKNTLILSVGTAYWKLLDQQGIRPDYVMFLDAAPRMYIQASGLEHETIPYLIASTACRKITEDYQGPKYLICQEGYPEAEQYARERGYQIYQSGGSVSTLAIDAAIRLGAARIVCLGLDLAYTGNKMHATHAGRYQITETEDMLQVKDWDGNPVNTSPALNMYRKWIERRVERARRERPELEWINATEGGAYIQGMQHMLLSEVLAEL